jgi:hypothetical protein
MTQPLPAPPTAASGALDTVPTSVPILHSEGMCLWGGREARHTCPLFPLFSSLQTPYLPGLLVTFRASASLSKSVSILGTLRCCSALLTCPTLLLECDFHTQRHIIPSVPWEGGNQRRKQAETQEKSQTTWAQDENLILKAK